MNGLLLSFLSIFIGGFVIGNLIYKQHKVDVELHDFAIAIVFIAVEIRIPVYLAMC